MRARVLWRAVAVTHPLTLLPAPVLPAMPHCRLKFCVGPSEVPKFRMVERHYFKGRLIKSFDFEFGFCIPNSTNTWEAVYDLPPLEDDLGNGCPALP